MSIDSLIEQLERDVHTEVAALVSAAERQAEEILSRAAAARHQRRTEALGRLEQARRHAVACETAAAARGLLGSRLQERAAVLDRIFAEAEQDLYAASPERYQRLIPTLMGATLGFLEGMPAEIHCRPDIAAPVDRLRAGRADVEIRPGADAAAGILGASTDGSVVVDNTLPALLRRRRAELAVALATRLEAR